jgi:surfeit locus 1 family protein
MTPAPARRGLLLPGALALVGIAILSGLGVWQVQRLAWKQDLIARIEARTKAAPVPAPGPADWRTLPEGWLDFRPLTITGTFLHDDEVHVFTSLGSPSGRYGGAGYWIMTPLRTTEGWYVVVNRGFVPEDRKAVTTRAPSNRAGDATLAGLAQQSYLGNRFTPDDNPVRNIWFRRDPVAIAASVGLAADRVAPYMIDAFFDPSLPGGLPQGGETRLSFPNDHLQYAVTWFGLAAALAAVFAVFAWGRLQRGRG